MASSPIRFVAMVVGFVAIVPATYFTYRGVTHRMEVTRLANDLPTELNRAKSNGIPLDPSSLQAMLGSASKETKERFTQIAPKRRRRYGKPLAGAADRRQFEGLKAIKEYVEPRQGWLDIAHQFADAEGAITSRPWQSVVEDEFLDMSVFSDFTMLLGLSAELKWLEKNPKAALIELDTLYRLGRVAGYEPFITPTNQMARSQSEVYRIVMKVAKHSADDPAQLMMLEDFLKSHPPTVDMSKALRGEAYCNTIALLNPKYYPYPTLAMLIGQTEFVADITNERNFFLIERNPSDIVGTGVPQTVESKAILASSLKAWNDAIEIHEATKGTVADKLDAAKARLKKWAVNPNTPYGTVFAPARIIDRVFSNEMRCRTSHALTTATLKVMRYKAEKGVLPADESAAGLFIQDPYTGKPLKFRFERQSVRIWSVGENRKDDGGIEDEDSPFFSPDQVAQVDVKAPSGS